MVPCIFAVHKDRLAWCARTDDLVFFKTASVLWTKEDLISSGGDFWRKNRASINYGEAVTEQWEVELCGTQWVRRLGSWRAQLRSMGPLQTKFHMPQHLSWTDRAGCIPRCFNLRFPP
jgi:hypothetical protein